MRIDRSEWGMQEDGAGGYAVTVDGFDAGMIWEDVNGVHAMLDDAEWPGEDGPDFGSVEEAYSAIQRAWAEYWAWCNSCGDATTEEDRAILPEGVDDLGVYCPSCRGEGEPVGAFGYWPGEDARPSAADRPDGIGPEEAAAIMAEEQARRATYDTRPCGCASDPAQGGRQVLVCATHADVAAIMAEAIS